MPRVSAAPNSVRMRSIVQASITSPNRAAGTPTMLSGVATRRSQTDTSWAPAPSAGPSIAAITGADSVVNPRSTRARSPREDALFDTGEVGAGAECRRRPGQHDRPCVGHRLLCVEEGQQRLVIDRVAPLPDDRA